jgi:hypothetical protein
MSADDVAIMSDDVDADWADEVSVVVLTDVTSSDDVAVISVDVELSSADDEASTSANTGRKRKIPRVAKTRPMITNDDLEEMCRKTPFMNACRVAYEKTNHSRTCG